MPNSGNTALGLIGSLFLFGAISFFALRTTSDLKRGTARVLLKNKASANISSALDHIMRVGRLARSCSKVLGIPGALSDVLECRVKFLKDAPLPEFNNARFSVRSESGKVSLKYEKRSGYSETEPWQSDLKYAGVNEFVLCDSTNLVPLPSATPCPLSSVSGIGDLSGASDRFFRFRLGVILDTPNLSDAEMQGSYRRVPGAFFVRNSGAGDGGYLWGSNGVKSDGL